MGVLDETVALMIAQLVERQGIGARAEEADALSMSRIFGLDTKDVALVCLCYVENATSAQIRYAIRRLRRKAPEAYILVATLGEAGNTDGREALQGLRNADLVRSLRETIAHVLAVASDAREQDPEPDSNVPMRAAGSQRA
jgi:tRNA A37 methylthiotransferase MiaB